MKDDSIEDAEEYAEEDVEEEKSKKPERIKIQDDDNEGLDILSNDVEDEESNEDEKKKDEIKLI